MLLNTQIKQNKKQGVTLVEVLIVLAIAAVVIAGALVLYGNLQRNSAVNEETTNLSAMFQNIDNFFRRGSTDGLTNVQALTAGFIPGGMLVSNAASGIIENAFGGYVVIQGSNATGGNQKGFAISYSGIPQASCVNMIQGQARVGWDAIEVAYAAEITDRSGLALATGDASAYYRNNGTMGTRGSQPLSEIDIITMCTTDQNYVDISFVKDSEY